MAGISVELRDQIITGFRQRLCDKMEFTPFPHQAEWWMAGDGFVLLHEEVEEQVLGTPVLLPDGRLARYRIEQRVGGRARVLADLGAFKTGKSKGSAMWVAAFAAVPNARVQLIGLEYDICSPEFEYIVEALLSDQGLGLKYSSLQNRPRDGRMYLDLPNGARFEARSWERKDTLKGKEIDCYLACEAYQLPGLEVFTDHSQNLQKRKGYFVAATTPDRPWVGVFHEKGHGHENFPDWHCTCGVPRSINPYTYDASAQDRDDPNKGGLMTKEKFAIGYLGQLGDYVGRVYNYQRGQRVFSRKSHPLLWSASSEGETLFDLAIPFSWEIVGGADTGTFTSALLVAFDQDGDAYVLAEFPNYRYMAGEPDRDESLSIPQWANGLLLTRTKFDNSSVFWADQNSQWKHELRNYGVTLQSNRVPLETRTEISREYFQQGRIWLAPWLRALPFEIENAAWPEEAPASGKFRRLKDRDHTLDCLEHVLSKRPRGRVLVNHTKQGLAIESILQRKLKAPGGNDPHLGKAA